VTFLSSFLGVSFLKAFNYKVAVVVLEVVEHYRQKVRGLSADRRLTPFGFELKIAVIYYMLGTSTDR